MLLQQAAQQPSAITLALPFLIVFGIYYVIVVIPTRRNQKKVQGMIDNLKSGDKIVTNGGIYGTIVGFKDNRVQLRVAENVKIEIARSAVTSLQGNDQEQTKS